MRTNLARDPVVHEAFEMLKQTTEDGSKIHVRDLGELLYLVTHVTFTKSRLASVLKVVDPVYEVQFLDEPQCQFVVERVRNVLRAEDMQYAQQQRVGVNFHVAGELETPDFECCNCTSTTTPCCAGPTTTSSSSSPSGQQHRK